MSVELSDALQYEAESLDIEQMMANMMAEYEAETGKKAEVSSVQIRNMALAAKYLKEEMNNLTEMKKAVMLQWDSKIKAKQEQIDQINNYIEHWILEQNAGKKLTLDFATISVSTRKPKLVFNKEKADAAKAFLEQQGILQGYLKAPELDEKLLADSIATTMNQEFENTVDQVIQQYIETHPEEKLTKAKEKEIKDNYLKSIQERYAAFYGEFMELQPEKKSLSIRLSK